MGKINPNEIKVNFFLNYYDLLIKFKSI